LASSAHGAVIYEQTFATTSNKDPMSDFDWADLYALSSGGSAVLGLNNDGYTAVSTTVDSPPVPVDSNVNSVNGTGYSATATGGIGYTGTGGVYQSLVYTNYTSPDGTTAGAVAMNIPQASIGSFSFWADASTSASANSNAQTIAVEVGTQWYVSSQSDTMTTGSSTNVVQYSLAFLPSSTTWEPIAATAGDAFSPGTAAALPAGNIDGVGLYATASGGAENRFDSFVINSAVPEPTSLGLVGLGALGLLARRRSRNA
jgi:hypothetical protein